MSTKIMSTEWVRAVYTSRANFVESCVWKLQNVNNYFCLSGYICLFAGSHKLLWGGPMIFNGLFPLGVATPVWHILME